MTQSEARAARPVALSIAGSDSGGGAGIQADLRVFSRLGCFGTTAITAVTAQNLDGVSAVVGLASEQVRAQTEAVIEGFAPRALKTGMLWSASIVAAVAELVERYDLGQRLVVDPVMVATSGARLLEEEAISAYRQRLLPRARLVTPNLDEAAVLLERSTPISAEELDAAAAELVERFGVAVLLKGGHLAGDPIDLLVTADGQRRRWSHPRVEGTHTHGTGCMLSAAIAAGLATDLGLGAACERALAFVHDALAQPLRVGEVGLAAIERADAARGRAMLSLT